MLNHMEVVNIFPFLFLPGVGLTDELPLATRIRTDPILIEQAPFPTEVRDSWDALFDKQDMRPGSNPNPSIKGKQVQTRSPV